jgi:hypothetical protein
MSSITLSQIESRENQIREEGKKILARYEDCKAKGGPELKSVSKEMNAWTEKLEDLAWERKRFEAGQNNKMRNGGNALGYDGGDATTKAVTKTVSPLQVPVAEYRGLYEAVTRKLPSYRIDTKSAFAESGFTSGNLPPILMPQLSLDLPYEHDRAFAHFKQLTAPEATSVEYIQHTSNTNPASAVAELGTKPDLGMVLTTVTTPYVKIAALASVSMEALQDFGAFMQWVPQELQRAVIDAETNEVVNGSGSSPHMRGILNTGGSVLTRTIGADTPIDCIRKAINDIRVGSSFAKADLILTHPTTWADLTLQKSTTGQYLLNPDDPAALGDLNSIFGCKVITNAYVPAGTAIVADSQWSYAWTRHGLTIDINQYGSDGSTNYWTQNAVSFRCEERVAIGVARPSAVNLVTGLPSS